MESKSGIDLAVLIVIASMGVFFLVFFIIFIVVLYQKRMQDNKIQLATNQKEHQKKLLNASLEIAEQERQQIAQNLHDEVGLNLSILKINFNKLDQNSLELEVRENILATSYALIENSMEIVRGIHNDIRPRTLMSLGLVSAIKELGREINTSRMADVTFNCKEEIVFQDKNTELQLHRLIKEVLNNTLRHAKPSFIEINIENIENFFIVSILHDGMGITTERIIELAENSKGLGLKSIFTRIGLLDASIDFSIQSDKRAKVVIKCKLG